MATSPILVTGATGAIGNEVVAQLLGEGLAVRVLTRDAAKTARFGGAVDVAIGELGRPDTLGPAFAGVTKAFLLSSNNGGPNAAWEANALHAAKRAGVDHIVKLSGRGVDSYNTGSFIARQQAESEREVRASGLGWTILRPGFFASNFLNDFPVVAHQTLRLPAGSGKDCPIDPRDVAAVAVKALTTPGHEGKIYELTGPDLLTYADMVAEISFAVGKSLAYADVPAADWRQGMLGFGAPEPVVDALVQYFTAVKDGRVSTSSDFDVVMGRPAHSFGEWVRNNVEALRAQSPAAA